MSEHLEQLDSVLSGGLKSDFLTQLNRMATGDIIFDVAERLKAVTITRTEKVSTLPHKCYDYDFNDGVIDEIIFSWRLYGGKPLVALRLGITIGPYKFVKNFTARALGDYFDNIRSTVLIHVAPLLPTSDLESLFHKGRITLPIKVEVLTGKKSVRKNSNIVSVTAYREMILDNIRQTLLDGMKYMRGKRIQELYDFLKTNENSPMQDFGITDLDNLALLATALRGICQSEYYDHPWDHDCVRGPAFVHYFKNKCGVTIDVNDPVTTISAAIIAFGGKLP